MTKIWIIWILAALVKEEGLYPFHFSPFLLAGVTTEWWVTLVHAEEVKLWSWHSKMKKQSGSLKTTKGKFIWYIISQNDDDIFSPILQVCLQCNFAVPIFKKYLFFF